jgi:hypothetical protein
MTADTGSINGCGNCRHWLSVTGSQGGICRARPPVPLLLGMQRSAIGQPQPVVATYWPETAQDMACGEWSVRVADLAAIDFSRLETVEGQA